MRHVVLHLAASLLLVTFASAAEPALILVTGGKTTASVAVAAGAGPNEKQAAADLVHYIERMTGAKPGLVEVTAGDKSPLAANTPMLVIGGLAIDAEPALKTMLAKVAKPNPVLRADAIAIKRAGNRVYIAGLNDECHYFAVAELLRRWGCRWYLPTEFGECIPHHNELKVAFNEFAYAPPFEVRKYWIAWNGDTSGHKDFMRRNGMNEVHVPNGHALATYTKDLIPPGKTMFNVPIAEDKTAQHVAAQVLPTYAAGKDVMLGLEDGVYQSDSPIDKELVALQYDKYFLTQSYTDAFMVFYNKVAEALMQKAPNSKAKIGFLAYANITLPPVKPIVAKAPLVAYLAPIDIDPIHGIGDPKSAPVAEYKQILEGWAKTMQGRLVIYDYDQSMLVWRDLPNPSIQSVRRNIPAYRKAGILGVDTESRNALATIFMNLHVRARLLWDPTTDIDALLAEFYEKFYGPAASPMAEYWTAINKAWEDSIVTEHEYFVAPAIYTPELVAKLKKNLESAEGLMEPVTSKPNPTSDEKQLVDRMKFTRLGFEILDGYMAMTRAANAEADYKSAVAWGEKALAAREQLTAMGGIFTTYKVMGEAGYAWFPGEVRQYRELQPLVDGSKGTLIAKLPLEWNFRRDPTNAGAKAGWEKQPVDLAWWKGQKEPLTVASRQSNPGEWEKVRSDLYLQAQGIITKDFQSYTGHGWYQTDVELDAAAIAGNVHLHFPGVFNECWLYVNGVEVGHREQSGVWWMNDYRFEWDADLTGKLKAGKNSIVLRINNPHHMGGMFRRPFLYRAAAK